jgi:hypothetical protein
VLIQLPRRENAHVSLLSAIATTPETAHRENLAGPAALAREFLQVRLLFRQDQE